MSKVIRSYDDLLRKEKQMEELLQAQKELLVEDFDQLKEELKPAKAALTFFSTVVKKDRNNSLVNGGVNKVIDLIFNKLLPAKAGWLIKQTVPFIIKNYSSHFIADHKDQFMGRLSSWLGHKNGNGKAAPEAYTKEN